MPHLPRTQVVAYAVVAVAVLVLGGRWLASRASGGEQAAAVGWTVPAAGPGAERGAVGAEGDPAAAGAESDPAEAGGEAGGAASEGSAAVRIDAPSTLAVVHVVGAVRRPGVYRLGSHARVQDAIRRAGGATRKAELDAINLAALVQDGAQIVVPRRGAVAAAATASPAEGAAPGAPTAPINLNTATQEQLETLDGIGPATATKILDYRRTHGGFRSIDDLDEVSGIGPKRLAALRDKVTV